MSVKDNQFYDFADFRLDTVQKLLLRSGLPVPLTPKVFDTLQVFIQNPGQLLGKDALIEKIWPDRFVEESNLTSNVKVLRKALGDDATHPRFIENVPRRGYRFIAEVKQQPFCDGPDENTRPFSELHNTPRHKALKSRFAQLAAVGALMLIVGFGGFWYARSEAVEREAPILNKTFQSEKISTNGKVVHAVVSADGKNIVYTNGIEGKQSVWIRQLENASNIEIIPPSNDFYDWLELSPDGKVLYFARRPHWTDEARAIYRVSTLGGVPQKLVNDTEGWMSVSPDGSRISFVRCPARNDEYCSLWIADAASGTNERQVARRPLPIRIGDNEFSADGKSIIFALGQSQTAANEFGLEEVNIETGVTRELSTEKFFNIQSLASLPDGGGLLITASRIPNKRFDIWHVSLTGMVKKLTNDAENYGNLSLDRDANTLVATQIRQSYRLTQMNPEERSSRILTDASSATFAGDGNILFSSMLTGNDEVWRINADGGGQRQLTNDSSDDDSPLASPDNNSIFFASNRSGAAQIWRMNADGSDQKQITNTVGGAPLFVSADGESLYYHHALDKTLWRVSVKGGGEERVIDKQMHHFAISPDGSRAAYLQTKGDEKSIEIESITEKQDIKTIKIASSRPVVNFLVWMPNGDEIAYISVDADENYSLQILPLDGSNSRKIADLGNERIRTFSVAPDGKSFVITQGGWLHDAVLVHGLK